MSQDSHYAMEWTLANMVRYGDKLHLLHCVPTVPKDLTFVNPTGYIQYSPTPHLEQSSAALENARRKLTEGFCKRIEEASVPYELRVLSEEGAAFGQGIGDRICEAADELEASAVVVGAHRKSRLAEFMLGSISNFLVHHCNRPVVVLHAPPGSGSDAHLRSAGTRDIVVAVDHSEHAEHMFSWALKNVVRHGDTVHALHVMPAAPVTPIYQAYGEGMVVTMPGVSEEQIEARHAEVQADLEKRLTLMCEAGPDVHLVVDLVPEDSTHPLESVGSAICKTCEDNDAAMLVTMSGNKGPVAEFFMGSVTSYCTHHSKVPVLVLH